LVPLFWIWAFLKGRSQHWRPRRVLLAIVAFTLGITVVLVPVTVRNWVLHKQPVLVSSNAGLNFYLGNSGDYDAKIAIRAGADWEEFINQHVRAGRRVGPEMSGYLFEQAREYIAANPVEYLRLLIYKTYLFLKGDEIMRNQEIYAFRAYSTLLKSLLWKLGVPGGPGLAFPFGVLLPLAWPGCLLVLRKRHPEGLLLLAYGAGYSLTVIAFFITARYRLPVVLPITLLFAYGWSQAREWWNPAGVRVAAISGMVILGLISNWNSGPMPREMNPDAYYNLGRTLTNQGDLAGAEHYYRKALEMDPQDAAAWVSLGLHVYQETGALGKAESCYRQALEVRPGYATPVFNLGVVAERRNMPAQAESLYREAARLDPLFAAPHINLAVMALSRKDYRRAYEHYRQAYLRNPEDPEALVGLGVTAFETRGLAEALDFFNQAIGLDPSFPDTYFNLALVYTKLSDPGKAAYYARRAAELDPTDGDAYIIFADQMRSAGRTGEARKFLEEAIRRHPNLPGPREALEHLTP
jgi:tetratricopeptide (TPR) repeat protein